MGSRRVVRALLVGPVGLVLGTGLAVVPASHVSARVAVHTRAAEVTAPLERTEVRRLPFPAGHVALHWAGHPDAAVTVELSADGSTFGPPFEAERDEVGEHTGNGHTYGAVHAAGGAVAVRVTSDRPLGRLTVLALADGTTTTVREEAPAPRAGAATTLAQPRAAWGADESLRFDRRGREVWPPVFETVQKLVVHHTAGTNGDATPVAAQATIRSIYYYHAVTQGWGDIGYNFLADQFGNVYQGRHSAPGATTGENAAGKGVTAGHAFGYNSGTVGIALLGTFTAQGPTPSAAAALQGFLVWKANAHGLDAAGASTYTNPLNGTQTAFPTVAGHREVNATECPGDVLFGTLPVLRLTVRALSGIPDTTPPPPPAGLSGKPGKRQVTLVWTEPVDQGSGGNASGAAVYEIFRAGSSTPLARTSALTYTDSGLRSGTTYSYLVRAYDGAGNIGPAAQAAAKAG